MVVIFIRTLIIFIALVIVMRLMGKRQIGEMQPFEFVITLIIADLACVPMADVSIPLIYGIVAVFTLFLLHQLLSLLEQSGSFTKKIISGSPSIVLDKNGVNLIELKKNNMGVEDLIESMRALGYFSLDDLNYAIFESNGKLSAFENENLNNKGESLPLLIINDGKILTENLEKINLSKDEIISIIKRKNANPKHVEVLTIDGNGRAYFKARNKKFCIFNIDIKGEKKW